LSLASYYTLTTDFNHWLVRTAVSRSVGRVQLNAWNKAVVSRKNQLGLLTLNDAHPARGRSLGNLRELNLPRQLYLGGYRGGIYHPDSGVNAGLIGAVQRVRTRTTRVKV